MVFIVEAGELTLIIINSNFLKEHCYHTNVNYAHSYIVTIKMVTMTIDHGLVDVSRIIITFIQYFHIVIQAKRYSNLSFNEMLYLRKKYGRIWQEGLCG